MGARDFFRPSKTGLPTPAASAGAKVIANDLLSSVTV